ncbi:MAG: hypothetical protein DLM59_06615 [Pseudonocardiales bacterium]|nr:MAG: hypothetical protein DLM59_06615 [Pseudonocardiales bacterium]
MAGRRRGYGWLLLGCALLVGVAGCTAHKDPPLAISTAKATASPAPSFDSTDPVQAFLGWHHALNNSQDSLDPNDPGLTIYGQGPALTGTRAAIARFRAQGIRQAKPTAVIKAHESSRAVVKGKQVRGVTACLVEPANDFVDIKTGKPRAPAGSNRSKPVISNYIGVMVLGDDGKWRLDGDTLNDVPSCSAVH